MSYFNKKLFFVELRKSWNLPIIIIIGVFLLIDWAGTFLPVILGMIKKDGPIPEIVFSTNVKSYFGAIVPLVSLFFGVGIISNDIKSHWLRTILSRPVTKEEYLITKLLSIGTSIFAVMLLMGTIPVIFLSVFSPVPAKFDFLNVLYVHLAYLGNTFIYLSIASVLSCWLPNFLNVFILAVWMLADNILKPIVDGFLWDSNTAQIAKDFFFPSGFSDFINNLGSNTTFPYESLLWGIAALAGFLALALWNITFKQIDKGSE